MNYNWQRAYDYCRNNGAELVSIQSWSENEHVASLIPNIYAIWIGGSSKWHSGYDNWNTGEPNNQGNVEEKIMMYGNGGKRGKWNDERSSSNLRGIVCSYNKY